MEGWLLSTHSNPWPAIVFHPNVHATDVHGRLKCWRRWSGWLAAVSVEVIFLWPWHRWYCMWSLFQECWYWVNISCLSITLSNYSCKFGYQCNLCTCSAPVSIDLTVLSDDSESGSSCSAPIPRAKRCVPVYVCMCTSIWLWSREDIIRPWSFFEAWLTSLFYCAGLYTPFLL